MEKKKTVSVRMPGETQARLKVYALERKATVSSIVSDVMGQYLARQEARSVTAAAPDLVGSVTGPRDLARAARHLRGYGSSRAKKT